jgi:hypothetical protein
MNEAPWTIASGVPWRVLTSPAKQWSLLPSFLVGEYLFLGLAAVAFAHAWGQGEGRRRHVLAWVAALLTGIANDIFFMALPFVDNFWQAQGTIMLAARMPLYIPCVYTCFLYAATVSAWRANLPPIARAALTGLAASVFYAPYDIVGAKFLWWTWHDSDPEIANRILGAPIGSTMFIITFGAAFSWLLGRAVDKDPAASPATCAKAFALTCGPSTILASVPVSVLRLLDGGPPGLRGFVALGIPVSAMAWQGLRRASFAPPRRADRFFHVAVMVYFATLVATAAAFDPSSHRSTSLHQPYGPCHERVVELTGETRYRYVCAADFHEDFSFDCTASLPPDGADWYTVCGRPYRSRALCVGAVTLLGLVGALLYSRLLGAWEKRRRRSTSLP